MSDDYTNALHTDFSGRALRTRNATEVSANIFSSFWKDNGTKWHGLTYDSKYPFNGWKQDWGRLLDVDPPYFESVHTLSQKRAWFWDTCGPQVRQHRHCIIQASERTNILRLRGTTPSFGALEMIAAVHLFFYPEEEIAARIAEWNSLEFKSAGEKFLER